MQAEILKIISQGGLVSMLVAVVLFVMSVGSWTIMMVKVIQTRWIRRQNALFLATLTPINANCDVYGKGLEEFSCNMLFEPDSIRTAISNIGSERLFGYTVQSIIPYIRLAMQGLNAAERQNRFFKDRNESSQTPGEHIAQSLRRTIVNETLRLEAGLTLLATIGSLAPFVGLFGTVWGIYHALGAIAVGGQATVDKVAGPVGEALIMTAFGLAVAMPAVLAYNSFIRDNRLLLAELENFAYDLHASLTLSSSQREKPMIKAAPKQTMTVVS